MHDTVNARHGALDRRYIASVRADNLLAGLACAERRNVEKTNKRVATAEPLAQRDADLAGRPGNQDSFHVRPVKCHCNVRVDGTLLSIRSPIRITTSTCGLLVGAIGIAETAFIGADIGRR